MSPGFLEIALIGLNVDPVLREAIIGDLVEERTQMAAECGESFANRWMLSQMGRSIVSLAHDALRAGGARVLVRILVAAAAAFALVLLATSASTRIAFALFSTETMARFAIVVLAVDLAFGVAGGYLAARFGRAAPLASALVFGLLSIVLAVVSSDAMTVKWYSFALQVLVVPATIAGGWLRAKQLAAHR
jgi:hypothetical protein